jgi:hypothetical protein
MQELIIRFVVGGAVVSLFSILGDILRPKSFAGLFGAAPSIALATLSLTVAKQGRAYAAVESRSMAVGAVAFFVYAFLASWILMRYRFSALGTAVALLPVWFGVSLGMWPLIGRLL